MSIAQFHRALLSDAQHETLKTLRHISYEDLQGGDDQLSNWDPWTE